MYSTRIAFVHFVNLSETFFKSEVILYKTCSKEVAIF